MSCKVLGGEDSCKHQVQEGGDHVPYGSTTVTTPEGWICEHEDWDCDVEQCPLEGEADASRV